MGTSIHRNGLLIVLVSLLMAAAPATQPAVPRTLEHARKLLQNTKDARYDHKSDIDEAAGRLYCDCSGFVGYVFKQQLPQHFATLKKLPTHRRPLASDFHDTFAAAPAEPARPTDLWQKVETLTTARPGDVLVWRKDELIKGQDTGHVMFIDQAPRKIAPDTWAIIIIDSTSKPHQDDTRQAGQTGIGRGTVFVKTDDAGRPVAYASRSPRGPFGKHLMSIGRPVER